MSESRSAVKNQTDRQRIGKLGEDAVARHYESEGYTVVERNRHQAHNEIDLIVSDGVQLVFVEVKTRHGVYGARSRYGRPADAVNKAKRARTVLAAQAYLREHPSSLPSRIDVAEVYMTHCADGRDEVTRVVVFRNAFGAR